MDDGDGELNGWQHKDVMYTRIRTYHDEDRPPYTLSRPCLDVNTEVLGRQRSAESIWGPSFQSNHGALALDVCTFAE